MKKLITCLSVLFLAGSLPMEAKEGCPGCACTMESDCDCMSMPECINEEGTCTPEAHCGCHGPAQCDCSQCSQCSSSPGGCCAPLE